MQIKKPILNSFAEVRLVMIGQGLIQPRLDNTEEAECSSCGDKFQRLCGRSYDTWCGNRMCGVRSSGAKKDVGNV